MCTSMCQALWATFWKQLFNALRDQSKYDNLLMEAPISPWRPLLHVRDDDGSRVVIGEGR